MIGIVIFFWDRWNWKTTLRFAWLSWANMSFTWFSRMVAKLIKIKKKCSKEIFIIFNVFFQRIFFLFINTGHKNRNRDNNSQWCYILHIIFSKIIFSNVVVTLITCLSFVTCLPNSWNHVMNSKYIHSEHSCSESFWIEEFLESNFAAVGRNPCFDQRQQNDDITNYAISYSQRKITLMQKNINWIPDCLHDNRPFI